MAESPHLPQEVITHILQYLSVSDRKEASLVNTNWYAAHLDPILQQDTIITLHSADEADDVLIGLRHRKAANLVVSQLNFSELLRSGNPLTESLHSLSLKGTDVTEKNFLSILSQCPNLTKLDLSGCNSLFMSGKLLENNSDLQHLKGVLKKVKEVNLSSIRFLSDATFNRIMTVCANVEKLSLSSSQMLFYYDTYQSRDTTKCAHSSLLNFQNIEDFLKLQSTKLSSLNLSRTAINSKAMKAIANLETSALKELILIGCKDISDESIVDLCKKQTSLQKLDISQCPSIGDTAVHAICTHLTNIQSLQLHKCPMVSDGSVARLHELTSLMTLDLSSCHRISCDGLGRGLCSPNSLPRLTHVDLSCSGFLNDEFVISLCQNLHQLIHLDLASCFYITDKSVHAISKHLKYLRYLRLAWCKKITDLGLLGQHDENYHVHVHHDFDGECQCTRKYHTSKIFNKPRSKKNQPPTITQREPNEDTYSLTNVGGLKHLDLSVCPSISDNSIVHVIKFKELKSLNLNMCTLITDASLIAIATNVPCLEELYVSQCAHITDKSVKLIAEKLKRLTHLDISNLDSITNRSIEALCTHAYRLRYLDVSLCIGITLEVVEQLELCLKHLNTVQKRWVGQMNRH